MIAISSTVKIAEVFHPCFDSEYHITLDYPEVLFYLGTSISKGHRILCRRRSCNKWNHQAASIRLQRIDGIYAIISNTGYCVVYYAKGTDITMMDCAANQGWHGSCETLYGSAVRSGDVEWGYRSDSKNAINMLVAEQSKYLQNSYIGEEADLKWVLMKGFK